MKRSTLLCLLVAFFLTSCNFISRIYIDTYSPSEVIFPKTVKRVLIVNNAIAQPQDAGYEFKRLGVDQDTCVMKADSALLDACKALGERIVEADFFDDVLLFHEPTRTDSLFYLDTKLTQVQVLDLCEENNVEAVISIDRLIFGMQKEITDLGDGMVLGVIKIDVSGVVRAYIPEREKALASVIISDSLFYVESANHMAILNTLLPDANSALRGAAKYFSGGISAHFVPHWETETRWYYSELGNRWQEASAYASSEKWNEASEKWQEVYTKAKKWRSKAKAASNVALAFEMEDELDKALNWATISLDLYTNANETASDQAKIQKHYVQALTARVLNKQKLNIQFGEK